MKKTSRLSCFHVFISSSNFFFLVVSHFSILKALCAPSIKARDPPRCCQMIPLFSSSYLLAIQWSWATRSGYPISPGGMFGLGAMSRETPREVSHILCVTTSRNPSRGERTARRHGWCHCPIAIASQLRSYLPLNFTWGVFSIALFWLSYKNMIAFFFKKRETPSLFFYKITPIDQDITIYRAQHKNATHPSCHIANQVDIKRPMIGGVLDGYIHQVKQKVKNVQHSWALFFWAGGLPHTNVHWTFFCGDLRCTFNDY